MQRERNASPDRVSPLNNLEKFAPPYTPENFTPTEIKYLKPFFSNVDQPVFIVQHLPEEVIAALSAKYSRATESMRRIFLKEYVGPTLYPEKQKGWNGLNRKEKKIEIQKKKKFERLVNFLNKEGGIDSIVNIQRGRSFFDKWLVEFGDDSISEMGGIHLCIEGLSNIATKEIEDQRIGISPIEKSSRYVSFADRSEDGAFGYMVPGEIKGTPLEARYKAVMDSLFGTYSNLLEPYSQYIKELYPRGEDESDMSFDKSRKAKTFDDLRDLLPFSTLTNIGLYGNGRSFEYLINRFAEHPLGELRYWAYKITEEISKVTPSFIRRVNTPMGVEIQVYKHDIRTLRDTLSRENFESYQHRQREGWAKILGFSKEGEAQVIAALLFTGKESPSLEEIGEKVQSMSPDERKDILRRVLSERALGKFNPKREDIRHKKVPRAFESSSYLFELWARGGDYRDLQRHRMLTQERQNFTTRWGYDLEGEVSDSPFKKQVIEALQAAASLYEDVYREHPDAAQYLVPFAFIQHWYMNITAREMYYMGELRTGPQGRPHYRKVVQDMVSQAQAVHPNLFQGIAADWKDYSLARRESEKWTEKKRKELGV